MRLTFFKSDVWKILKKILVLYLLLIPFIYFIIIGFDLMRYYTDLCQDYVSARFIIHGKSAYLPNSCWGWRLIPLKYNPHPPFSILPFIPFTLLPIGQANFAWLILSVVFYAASLVLVLKMLNKQSAFSFALLLCISVFWDPLRNASLNQSIIHLILFLITLAWLLESKKKERASGLLIGIATLLRFWPGLYLLPALVARKTKLLTSALLTILTGTAVTLITNGIGDYKVFFGPILKEEEYQILNPDNISLVGLTAKLFLLHIIDIERVLTLAKASSIVLFISLLIFTLIKTYKQIGDSRVYIITQSLLLNAHIIVFPVVWGWGLVVYIVIYAMLFSVLKKTPVLPALWWVLFGTSIILLTILKIYVPRYSPVERSITLTNYISAIDAHTIIALGGAGLLMISQLWLLHILSNKASGGKRLHRN